MPICSFIVINIGPIITVALAVAILSVAFAKFASFDIAQIGNGLLGVTALLTEMVAVSILLGRYGQAFGKGSLSLIFMAFAVSQLAKVVISLGSIQLDALVKGVSAVAALVAVLTAFSVAASVGKKSVFAAGAGVLLFAFGIKTLSGVLASLGNLEDKTLLKGAVALGAITVAIIGFSYALWAAPVGKLSVVGLGLIIVSAGMTALAGVAYLFSRFSWTSLAKAGAAIGTLFVAISAASWLVNPLGLFSLAGALTVLGVSLFALAVDFQMFSSIGFSGLIISLGALIGIFVIMGAAATFLGPLAPVILSLSAAMLLFGASLALIGAGSIALAAGLAALGPGLISSAAALGMASAVFIAGLIEGAAEILHAIALLSDALTEAFIAIGIAITEAIISLAVPIATAVTLLYIALLEVTTKYMEPLVDRTVDFIDKFLDLLLEEALPVIGEWLWKIVVKVADLLLLLLEGLLDSIGIGGAAIRNLRDTVNSYWDNVFDESRMKRKIARQSREMEDALTLPGGKAGEKSAQAYIDEFLGTLRRGKDDISQEAQDISDTLDVIPYISHKASGHSGRSGSFGAAVEEATQEVQEYSETVDIFAEKAAVAQAVINGDYGNGEKRRNALIEAGYDPDDIQKVVNAILDGSYQMKTAVDDVDESVKTLAEDAETAQEKTTNIFEIFGQAEKNVDDLGGSVDELSKATDGADDSADGFSDGVNSVIDSVMKADTKLKDFSVRVGSFGDAMDEATKKTDGFAFSMQKMSKAFTDVEEKGFVNGQMWSGGYIKGMESLTEGVYKSSADIGKQSEQALREAIDAHSPSRISGRLGVMFAIGYVENILSRRRDAYLAGRELGLESADGLANPFATLHTNLDDLYSFSPTVSPILDLSNVNDGMRYLQNEFSANPAFGVRQTWTTDAQNIETLLSMEGSDRDISKIISEMRYLRDDIVRVGEELSKTSVYLDTGVLVGEMSDLIDQSLGQSTRRSVRSGRR